MEKYKDLIAKYNAGKLTAEELALLEQCIENDEIELSQLKDVSAIEALIPEIYSTAVSKNVDDNFYSMLANERAKHKLKPSLSMNFISWWNTIWQSNYQWAYSVLLLLVGLLGGYFWSSTSVSNTEVQQLSAEVQQMKELMLLGMLENKSSTDRLKAVSLSAEMDTVSSSVSGALLKVLKSDENTNVRLAAVRALAQFSNDPDVRARLIGSIKFQDSPLVQLAMAELMVWMKEEKSVVEFESIIKHKDTPPEVKKELQSTMQALI